MKNLRLPKRSRSTAKRSSRLERRKIYAPSIKPSRKLIWAENLLRPDLMTRIFILRVSDSRFCALISTVRRLWKKRNGGIAAKIKELPKGAWVLGRGWDHTLWNNRLPTRQDLDQIAPENPVFLQRVDGHIAWANSLALKSANITKDTKAPTGGEIVFDESGEPSGVLKETAMGLVSAVIPQTTAEETLKGIELALDEAKKYGLTSVQGGSDYTAIPLYRQFLKSDKLTVRVAVWQNFETPLDELKKQREDFLALKENPSRLKLGILKGYVDGTLGSRTAAMLAPFSDDPGKQRNSAPSRRRNDKNDRRTRRGRFSNRASRDWR